MQSLKGVTPLLLIIGVTIAVGTEERELDERIHIFAPLPSCGLSQTPCLPTPNDKLLGEDQPGYVARSRTNPEYGLPGWTRSEGQRFHKGVDILPVRYEKTKETVRIQYYDPRTGRSFAKSEPVLVPKDEIFAILDGVVMVANKYEQRSGYGRYVMIEHQFADDTRFISMYAHLNWPEVTAGDPVKLGDRVGWMGCTSSSSGGRSYLKAIPHCHFEVGRVMDAGFAATPFARGMDPAMLGGKFDPRNIQPYDPLNFLIHYEARPRSELRKDPPKPPAKKEEKPSTETDKVKSSATPSAAKPPAKKK